MKINRKFKAELTSIVFQLLTGGINDLEALRLVLDRILMEVELELEKRDV